MEQDEYRRMFEEEDRYWWFLGKRALVRSLVERYATRPSAVALDVGCGTGGTLQAFSPLGGVWVGVERSELGLEFGKKRGLPRLLQASAEALPVRSGAVEQTFTGDSRVRVLRRIGRRGLPSALAEGTNQAKGAAVVWLDADGSMPAADIPALLAGLADADVAVGSRYAPGGHDTRTSRFRIVTSWLINGFAALVLGGGVRDFTSGFIAARRSVLDRVPIRIDYVYGEYCIDFLHRATRAGFRVRDHIPAASGGVARPRPPRTSLAS